MLYKMRVVSVGSQSEFHRELKQLTGVAACQCRKARIQRNHIGCALLVWTRLKVLAYQSGKTVYQLKHGMLSDYLIEQLKYPSVQMTLAYLLSISEKATAETFKQDDYSFLIVANKFQTGFDQPLLHTMYVDKKLGGVNAVQTLSRLNRIHPSKEDTMVLDFANEAEDIQKAFADYYDRTILSEGTDPNLLYDLQTQLEDFDFYDSSDLDRFAAIFG